MTRALTEPFLWGIGDAKAAEKLEAIAPIAAIDFKAISTQGIERFGELAAALGADIDAPAVAGARTRVEQASEALREAVAAKPGLTVLGVSGTSDAFYVAEPDNHGDLSYFRELGLELVVPAGEDEDSAWDELSWEQAGRDDADLIIVDGRVLAGFDQGAGFFDDVSTWTRLPAVREGQVGIWHPAPVLSYDDFARNLEDLTTLVESARADVV